MQQQESGRGRARWLRALGFAPDDLLFDHAYRRLWLSTLLGALGGQVTLLALPLTAALLLQASPTQMGLLTAVETLPFVLFSLPAGVWLDRVRKLPVFQAGEWLIALAVASVPLAWWAGWLDMPWLYAVGFVVGTVYTFAGSAAQIVLTQVVPRERLVEAHARSALASSGAEVAGPGLAGVLIRLVGAPVALLVDAAMLLGSALVLRGLRVSEDRPQRARADFWADLRGGLRFVRRQRLLVLLAAVVGGWQLCHHAVQGVLILHATRALGLGEQAIGLCYVMLGVGTVSASMAGHRLSERIGPGPTLLAGFACCGLGWLLPALLPQGPAGVAALAALLGLAGVGSVLIYVNFLAIRQSVTPAPLLGRMTATMRWLILLPAAPGALLGGWVGERAGLTVTLGAAGALALLLAAVGWHVTPLRGLRQLPDPDADAAGEAPPAPGGEALQRPPAS